MISTLAKLTPPSSQKKKGSDILLVQIYVDDIIFDATNKSLCKKYACKKNSK